MVRAWACKHASIPLERVGFADAPIKQRYSKAWKTQLVFAPGTILPGTRPAINTNYLLHINQSNKKEAVLDLTDQINKQVLIKFSGGREGSSS